MSGGALAAFAALAGAAISALVAWLVNARKLSGDIGTSDAEQLWTESRAVREHITAQLLKANERIVALETRVDVLARENVELRQQLLEQERRNGELNERIVVLSHQLEEKSP